MLQSPNGLKEASHDKPVDTENFEVRTIRERERQIHVQLQAKNSTIFTVIHTLVTQEVKTRGCHFFFSSITHTTYTHIHLLIHISIIR